MLAFHPMDVCYSSDESDDSASLFSFFLLSGKLACLAFATNDHENSLPWLD